MAPPPIVFVPIVFWAIATIPTRSGHPPASFLSRPVAPHIFNEAAGEQWI
ncbi:hypothetical protein [Azospirillum palustre]